VSDLLLGVDGRVPLQCTLNKYNVKVWAAFMFRMHATVTLWVPQKWGNFFTGRWFIKKDTAAFCLFVCLSV